MPGTLAFHFPFDGCPQVAQKTHASILFRHVNAYQFQFDIDEYLVPVKHQPRNESTARPRKHHPVSALRDYRLTNEVHDGFTFRDIRADAEATRGNTTFAMKAFDYYRAHRGLTDDCVKFAPRVEYLAYRDSSNYSSPLIASRPYEPTCSPIDCTLGSSLVPKKYNAQNPYGLLPLGKVMVKPYMHLEVGVHSVLGHSCPTFGGYALVHKKHLCVPASNAMMAMNGLLKTVKKATGVESVDLDDSTDALRIYAERLGMSYCDLASVGGRCLFGVDPATKRCRVDAPPPPSPAEEASSVVDSTSGSSFRRRSRSRK